MSDTMDAKLALKAEHSHQVESLNILVFVCLLLLTVLTIWLFKHRRFIFVHETGLAIIYGLSIGAVITYTMKPQTQSYGMVTLINNMSLKPPDILKVQMICGNTSQFYQYTYKDSITGDMKHNQDADLIEKATFNPEVFFNVILPPIIFNAGYHMKRKHFFKNFGAILTYAFLGTTVSCFSVGGLMYGFSLMISSAVSFTDCLLFGAIISATDAVTVVSIFNDLNVDVDLYALVFGESILNDAVAIVLASSIEEYIRKSDGFDGFVALSSLAHFLVVFFGSFALGSGMGSITALLTKFTRIQDFPLLETSLFVLMSYGTFLAAEAADLSGIVAVLFCGISQAHYTYNNLSKESQMKTKEVFELLNFLMENFVFTYIGVSVFTFHKHSWNAGYILLSFPAILIACACNIYPLSFLLNLGRSNRISWSFQHMIMFSGLRGAVAFALAMRDTSTEARCTILSTTLIIVIVSVILCGGFTTKVLHSLKIRVGIQDDMELRFIDPLRTSRNYSSIATTTAPGSSDAVKTDQENARLAQTARLVWCWHAIDNKFIKPFLTHAQPPLTETLPKCCVPIGRILTSTEQMSNSQVSKSNITNQEVLGQTEVGNPNEVDEKANA